MSASARRSPPRRSTHRHFSITLRAVVASFAIPLVLAGCSDGAHGSRAVRATATGDCSMSAILVPSCGAWWGAAAEPSGTTSQVAALRDFESRLAVPVPVVHFYEVGDVAFPTDRQLALVNDPAHPRVLFFNWRPAPDRSWRDVAAGDPLVDARIDRTAQRLRALSPRRFFLSILAEPEDEVRPDPGSGYTAQDYAAMYRHVVSRLRADGVTNAITVMNYIGLPNWVAKPWFAELYPGADVVDWLAYDRYVRQSAGASTSFLRLASDGGAPERESFLGWAVDSAPDKPIMIAEWGAIADPAHASLKTELLASFGRDAPKLPQIKGFLFWESSREGDVSGGAGTGSTEISTIPTALAALRTAVSQPYFSRATAMLHP